MPVFKVWNCSRTVRKSVIGSSLGEVLKNGATKLGFPESCDNMTAVLEEDGTSIDEDDILLAYQGKTIILLLPGEVWTPEASSTIHAVDMTSPTHTSASPPEEAKVSTGLTVSTEQPNTSVPSMLPQQVSRVYSDTEEIATSPLPSFSPHVLQYLDGKGAIPERIWSMIISECGHYYFGKWPQINNQHQYKVIGSRMYQRYPNIGLDGEHPWSAFNKGLSQKIRHLRLGMNTKSQTNNIGEAAAKKGRFNIQKEQTSDEVVSDEDVSRHSAELQKEWNSPPHLRNKTHIKKLLKATRQDRKEMLKTSSYGISEIFKKYPCFQDCSFILYEFGLIFGSDRIRSAATNLKKVLFGCEQMGNIEAKEHDDPLRMLTVIRYIEQNTRLHQGGKGGKGQQGNKVKGSVVQVYEDIAEADITKKLSTFEGEGPRIVLFLGSEGDIQGLYLTADTVFTQVNKDGGVMAAVLKLIAMYYTFDLEYPRQYAMVLGVLQTYVMEEAFKKNTSAKYKRFVKELQSNISELPEP